MGLPPDFRTNQGNISRLEAELAARIRGIGANQMYVRAKETKSFIQYSNEYQKQAKIFYEELEQMMTPEIREKMASLQEQISKLDSILCYLPEGESKTSMISSRDQAIGWGADCKENSQNIPSKAFILICQLSNYFRRLEQIERPVHFHP